VLWLWWVLLLLLSALGLLYRLARISLPVLSPAILLRVPGRQLRGVALSAADYFVLDLLVQNMDDRKMEQVLEQIEKKVQRLRAMELGELSGSLPSEQQPSSAVMKESDMPARLPMAAAPELGPETASITSSEDSAGSDTGLSTDSGSGWIKV
jgi:hypothetical protein